MYKQHRRGKQYCALCFEDLAYKGNFIHNEVMLDACCSACRKGLNRQAVKTVFKDTNIYSEYIYQEEIRLAILQYKESLDKYLARIFFHPYWSYYFRQHLVVLVPSTKDSRKRRRFDHIELLAIESGFKNIHRVFEHKGIQQQALKKTKERVGVRKEIVLTNKKIIRNKKILILDDIITSGNTVIACVELLKPYAKSIDVLTIAKSPNLEGESKRLHLPFS